MSSSPILVIIYVMKQMENSTKEKNSTNLGEGDYDPF
jgi:hypothetical protein